MGQQKVGSPAEGQGLASGHRAAGGEELGPPSAQKWHPPSMPRTPQHLLLSPVCVTRLLLDKSDTLRDHGGCRRGPLPPELSQPWWLERSVVVGYFRIRCVTVLSNKMSADALKDATEGPPGEGAGRGLGGQGGSPGSVARRGGGLGAAGGVPASTPWRG